MCCLITRTNPLHQSIIMFKILQRGCRKHNLRNNNERHNTRLAHRKNTYAHSAGSSDERLPSQNISAWGGSPTEAIQASNPYCSSALRTPFMS